MTLNTYIALEEAAATADQFTLDALLNACREANATSAVDVYDTVEEVLEHDYDLEDEEGYHDFCFDVQRWTARVLAAL